MAHDVRFIPFAKPWMDEKESEAAKRIILSGWITQGPEVEAFEKEFAAYVGSKYACAVSSCTTALHLALLAVGVRPGDEVITVSHSFIATANSIRYCGATPVFADIQPESFNINPELLEVLITKSTRAILCVHQIGMPCDLKAIVDIAYRHSLPVVEDAACAIGSEICLKTKWERIGKPHGDIACFSFHPRKVISTGDGGMITTANHDWDRQFRLWRHHGMNVPDALRHKAKKVIVESYPVLGYNYRMTDIQAAIGREQVKRLPDIIDRRRSLATRYNELLRDVPGLDVPVEPAWARSNWQSYCIRLPGSLDQLSVMQLMLDRGVATRRGVMCTHREGAYAYLGQRFPLPESEKAQEHCILLPLYYQMSTEEQEYVAQVLLDACSTT